MKTRNGTPSLRVSRFFVEAGLLILYLPVGIPAEELTPKAPNKLKLNMIVWLGLVTRRSRYETRILQHWCRYSAE
jgi:hypothetical protein